MYNNLAYQSPSHKHGKGKKTATTQCESHISSHHLHICSALLGLKCPPQTQSHLQFTPFYLAGSLGLYIDVPPTWPFNMILSAHRVFRQHNTKRQLSLFSLKLARYFFFFLLEIWNQYGVCRSQHDLTLSESCFHALVGSGEGYFPSASF